MVFQARRVVPSARGELEITDLNRQYLEEGLLQVQLMGAAWPGSTPAPGALKAGSYIRTLEHRQSLKVGCPEEVAWRKGWLVISNSKLAAPCGSGYGDYLLELMDIPIQAERLKANLVQRSAVLLITPSV